jgi:integrase
MTGKRTSGSVRRRPSGKWQARVRDPLSGRLTSLGTFATKADADRSLNLAIADQTRGAWIDPERGRLHLTDYATRWLLDRAQLRPRTRELYEGLLRLHVLPTLGHLELAKITPSAVRRWHASLVRADKPGTSTIAKAYRLLHAILATATADELIVKNPCVLRGAGIERAPEREVITIAQVWEVADAVEPRFRVLVLMAAFTGLRRGELFGLTRARVDLLHKTVTVAEQRQQLRDGTIVSGPPKTDAGRRTLVLPEPIVPELEAHLAAFSQPGVDGLVFTGDKGGPLRDQVWQTKWARARRAVGQPDLHFHDLRHVANTLTAASGASTRELMHRMGHASPDAALRYQHATRDRDAAIAAALADLITAEPVSPTALRATAEDRQ